jgi:hypothetical protein
MTPPKTFEEWIEEMPDGYQFAFVVITRDLNEDQTQLLSKRKTKADFLTILNAFYHAEKALKESKEQFIEDRFDEFLEGH